MGGCTSDPTTGCGDNGALVGALQASNDKILEKLTSIDSKLAEMQAAEAACCETTNGHLSDINDKLQTLITNSASCCDSITTKLNTIIGILQITTGTPDTPLRSFDVSFYSHTCVQV